MSRFTLSITAQDADIDELGHVNNAVWVQWIQAIATAHWEAVAPAEHKLAYVWVVTRHEIDYRGSVVAGETVVGETWVEGAPKGARFDRHVRFVGDDGRVKLEAVTTWALLDRGTGRLMRVREDVAAPFYDGPSPLWGEGGSDAGAEG
ncbi:MULTISPECIES: acyl-CoA thioesterase [unclassified Sphingomonas]|uniref:acyl-CoA thioesterase n=1 Tax=unclassified Sphingomonas TaxID=196159 RepID=UPI000E75F3C6|nr:MULTISPECIES: acyl-CoA thioesterase [unclassified Sphingomonas]RKE44584.1 acyl-CoA thioester hydrolase [Sphingomonas sp. PP-CC-1A-547]TCM06347.1 acyl-CoA thioester hydrolase [Sphingomonas sp. PP-CC-3G-468]